jgi:predicted SAM-dependent methyltransferase
MDRREKLLLGLELNALEGAEIGALNRPIVKKSDGCIFYIDHVDSEKLRGKYSSDPAVDVSDIVEVDAVWGENTIQEALGVNRKVDYVIASHVVEHVPDLVSWLGELSSVLKPGGTIRLAVPDMRFCFDYLRKETRLTDVIAAYFHRARRPEIREIIDWAVHFKTVDTVEAWSGRAEMNILRSRDAVDSAFGLARRAQEGEYIDVHCWAFTPESFVLIMENLSNIGFTNLSCRELFYTEKNDLEFIVILGVESGQENVVNSWSKALSGGRGRGEIISDSAYLLHIEALERRVADLACDVDTKSAELSAVRNSTCWKITGPLRQLVQRFR